MNLGAVVKNIISEELKNLHTAFIAKILSVNGNKAKIQPLGLIKQYGKEAEKQAPLTNVHIARSALYKISSEDGEAKLSPIGAGDIVLCVCCDRNISSALKGENTLPPIGCHRMSDCVIVSII